MTEDMPPSPADTAAPLLTFVVIGYNEGAHLQACFDAIAQADLDGIAWEWLYVDGGSQDESIALAQAAGVDRILGGDKQRRAAENRNLGLQAARGEFVQFVDGDMALAPGWPRAALAVLGAHPDGAAVFGRLQERNQGVFYRALEIDWRYPEGPALYCGGAALFRRAPLLEAGGFPEDVAYGEEPLLCWRLRNHQGLGIYHAHALMAHHDLAYQGFRDYWRRNVRVGRTYAEIAARCRGTAEPFWSREVRATLLWATVLLGLAVLAVGLPGLWRLLPLALLAGIWARKTVQAWRGGAAPSVAAVYGAHTYFSKLGIAWGILRFALLGR